MKIPKEYIIYGTLQCKYCDMAKALLDSKGIPWTYVDARTSEFFKRTFIAKGVRTVPQIFEVFNTGTVNEVYVGGYDDLKEDLNEQTK